MAAKWGRDRRGRTYWYDSETGKRIKEPPAAQRPRAYRKDKRGRGYWTWLDTGRRAPKPAWDAAPRYDAIGRPLDSTGRLVPRAALESESVLAPLPEPKPAKLKHLAPTGPRKKVRPKILPRARAQVRRGDEAVPGFAGGTTQGVYLTRATMSPPKDLEAIFKSWLKGAVAKSPMGSASEIGFRQHGLAFKATVPLDTQALAELTTLLEGQPVRVVYRVTGRNEWEIWLHANRPDRRTAEIPQKGYRKVADGLKAIQAAASIVYDYLMDWDADFYWYEYFETDDSVYEG